MDAIIVLSLVFGLPFGIGLFFVLRKSPTVRSLERMETRPLASLSDGEDAKIVGTIYTAGNPLRSPISHRDCVFYQLEIWSEGGSITQRQNIERLFDETRHCSKTMFRDTSAEAEVELIGADIILAADAQGNDILGRGSSVTPELEAFIAERDLWVPYSSDRKTRFRERVLINEATVAIRGKVATEITSSPSATATGYREPPLRRRLEAPASRALVIVEDVNPDGVIISDDAWFED